MLRPSCLLRLDSNGLDAWNMHGRTLARSAEFGAGGDRDFAAWLARQPARQRYRLLVDLAEEGFEIEDIPRVRGADRRALLARRLAHHFPDPSLATASSLGRAPASPHLERVLLHGLTRPGLLAPWLAALCSAAARLEAVIPAAALLGWLAPPALRERGSFLLVNFGRSGTRLSHFDCARLRFSRLAGGTGGREGAGTADWPTEVVRTRNYVAAQAGRPAGAELAVIVLARDTAVGNTEIAGLRCADPAGLWRLPASTPPAAEADLTPTLLRALARAPLRIGWPAGESTGSVASQRWRLAIPAVGGAFFAGCLAIAATRWATVDTLTQEGAERERALHAARREIAQLELKHAALPLPPQALIDVVAALDHEHSASIDPADILRAVASRLESLPALQLDRLSWRRAAPDATPGSTGVVLELRPARDDRQGLPATRLQFELRPGGRP